MSLQTEKVKIENSTRAAGWSDGHPSIQEESHQIGTSIRTLENGQQGLVTSKSENPNIDDLTAKARAMALLTPSDPLRQFADASFSYPPVVKRDENIFDLSMGDLLSQLERVEKSILKADKRIKKVVRLDWELEKSQALITNSLGLNQMKESSSAQLLFEVLAEDKENSEVGWDMMESRFAKNLNPEELGLCVAKQAIKSLGGKAIQSGEYPVVVHPRVGVQFFELLTEALSAEEVHLGRSFLQGFEGKKVASPCVTLVDDPFNPDLSASEHFDDEGVPHQTLSIVENGNLLTYFYDLRSAARQKKKPTGNGVRDGLGAIPKPGPSNFYLKPGAAKREDLLKSSERVFLLEEVMGLHMADPMTGEFSLGASGSLYLQGKFLHPVRGITIAGQLKGVLENIVEIADDLHWYGSLGSPSFLVKGLVVSGQN